ncbi:uncharacterized protein LOC115788643 isoform X2 [Archocentrus centrarchus]|uniref:uncharacterized protein LOC115788643 isoform X2 n=1 Tax=Archocentrus centrarchus TaxID=63155 RepID=UPI0011EA07B4|nr:uncharacterized protein LOC115788643 isoform X2 [Archocentrus centrarchus]
MWSRCALKDKKPSLDVKFSLPVLSNNKSLVSGRPKSQEVNLMKLEDEIVCNLGGGISWIPSATRSTTRHREASQWQAQFSEIMYQLEREITAQEQLKDVIDSFLQNRQLYSQLMGDCITVTDSLSSGIPRQDPIFTALRKEERLINDNREVLQVQFCILLSKISSLKKIHSQLEEDFHAKGEATKLTMKCITLEHNTPSSCMPACQYKPHHVSYDMWLSRCKDLKMTANTLMKDSSSFRGYLKFTLANISDEIYHQTKEIQKLSCQIRGCYTKLHQASKCLDILNQRPGYELCRDLPHISLTLENYDLVKIGAGLHSVLKLSHRDPELKHKRLMIVEDKLAKNAHILEMEKKCQILRQTFPPARDTIVILSNKDRLDKSMGSSSCHAYLQ